MALPKEHTDNILEAAFDKAFSPPPSRRQSLQVPPTTAPTAPPTLEEHTPPTNSPESTSVEDTWKRQYEEQVKSWRAQSAEAREKAEKLREQWEERRDVELREIALLEAARQRVAGISNEQGRAESRAITELLPNSVNLRVHLSGEPQRPSPVLSSEEPSRAQSQPDTADGSQKWEEVNSPTTSSYPSLSLPEQTTTPPSQTIPPPASAPHSVTLSVFDSSLSTRTRLKALTSSLVINLFLPFVNGVMLGFGEIFAKNFVLGWLGWGAAATNVGITRHQRPGFR